MRIKIRKYDSIASIPALYYGPWDIGYYGIFLGGLKFDWGLFVNIISAINA